jgi:hypothetical protein
MRTSNTLYWSLSLQLGKLFCNNADSITVVAEEVFFLFLYIPNLNTVQDATFWGKEAAELMRFCMALRDTRNDENHCCKMQWLLQVPHGCNI